MCWFGVLSEIISFPLFLVSFIVKEETKKFISNKVTVWQFSKMKVIVFQLNRIQKYFLYDSMVLPQIYFSYN